MASNHEHRKSSANDGRLESAVPPGIASHLLELFRMRQAQQTRSKSGGEILSPKDSSGLDMGPSYDFTEQLDYLWDNDLKAGDGGTGGELSDMINSNGSLPYFDQSYDQIPGFPLLDESPTDPSLQGLEQSARPSDENLRELMLREDAVRHFGNTHLSGQYRGASSGVNGASRRGLKRTLGALQPADGDFVNEQGAGAEQAQFDVSQLLEEMDMLLPAMLPAQYPAGLMEQGQGSRLRNVLDDCGTAGSEWGAAVAAVADDPFQGRSGDSRPQNRATAASCSNSDESSGASGGRGGVGSAGTPAGSDEGGIRRVRHQKASLDETQPSYKEPSLETGADLQPLSEQLASRWRKAGPPVQLPATSNSLSAAVDPNGHQTFQNARGAAGGAHGYPPQPSHPSKRGGRVPSSEAGKRSTGRGSVNNSMDSTSQPLAPLVPKGSEVQDQVPGARWQPVEQSWHKGPQLVEGGGLMPPPAPPPWMGLGGDAEFDPSVNDPPFCPAGSQLEQLLINCAEAIDGGELRSAHGIMQALIIMVSPHGTAGQRMAYYFLEGLAARIVGTGSAIYQSLRSRSGSEPGPASKEMLTALLTFLETCPYANFGHVAANSAILEAVEGEKEIHIVDFGITHGTQWPTLIESLAMRTGGAPKLRITGVDAPQTGLKPSSMQETGRRLSSFAKLMGVPFEFNPITEHLENLQMSQFDLRPGEALAVSCVLRLHQLLDESRGLHSPSPRNTTLKLIRQLKPKIVILVEQHTDHNLLSFRGRFREALHYYSALFNSLDNSLPWHSTERVLIEERVLGRKIVNIVACEGAERIERHESLGRWQYRMQRAGFKAVRMSAEVVENVQALLRRYRDGYGLDNVNKAIMLTWRGQQLLAASTWTCADLDT